jgi:hypothetical protein
MPIPRQMNLAQALQGSMNGAAPRACCALGFGKPEYLLSFAVFEG